MVREILESEPIGFIAQISNFTFPLFLTFVFTTKKEAFLLADARPQSCERTRYPSHHTMLPIISTKNSAGGRQVAATVTTTSAAAASSAEKKLKKRPRAVLPKKPKPPLNNSIHPTPRSTNHVQKIVVGGGDGDREKESNYQQCNNGDEEENALVLAAEAAAALILGNNNDYIFDGGEAVAATTAPIIQATSSTTTNHMSANNDGALANENSMELLENIVASLKVVQEDVGGGGGGTAWGGDNSDNHHHYQNPLGPSSQVQIFESKVPTMLTSSSLLEMSDAQRDFLAQYYESGGADNHDNRNNDDEDEEIIEEDADDGRNNSIKINVDVSESLSGETIAMTTTLRSMCKRIPRSTSTKKPKNLNDDKKKKKRVSFHESDMENLLKKDEGENNVADLTMEEHAVGPQVTVDEHGTIVIAQDSLLPNPENRQSTTEIDQELLGGGSVIDEGETPSHLGAIQARYDSYTAVPRTVPVRWSVRETKDFYNALRQCGTDFSLMQMFCLGRTRDQLKRKFKVESRKNARLVDMALDPKCHVKLGKLRDRARVGEYIFVVLARVLPHIYNYFMNAL